ncbi:MAG: CvpA family protein [Deltaproteobacteria bacterium]|nr:CvpA family protein [Deltaproteobacteria bacterium]
MNALDIGICFILSIPMFIGFFKGFIRGISSLIALVAGLLLAKRYYIVASGIITSLNIPDPKGILGYICVFLVFYIGIKIVARLLHGISRVSGLSPLDRILGGLLGLLKGGILAIIIITLLQVALPKDSVLLKQSAVLPYSNKALSYTKGILPKELYNRLKKVSNEISGLFKADLG